VDHAARRLLLLGDRPGRDGHAQIRLAYSRVADDLIDEGIRRIGEVLRTGREAE